MSQRSPVAEPGKPKVTAQGRQGASWMRGLAATILFLAIVAGGAWYGLAHIERRTRESVGDALRIVVSTTEESLATWFQREKRYAEQLAADPQFVELARRQLGHPRDRESLMASESFSDLRTYMAGKSRGPESVEPWIPGSGAPPLRRPSMALGTT